MQHFIVLLYKGTRRLCYLLKQKLDHFITLTLLYCNNVSHGAFRTYGIPYIMIARGGVCSIGNNLIINNQLSANPIGRVQRCIIFVDTGAEVIIGRNVSMSFTAINCQKRIVIKDRVMIGGGVCIYDSDFHPLDAKQRNNNDSAAVARSEVIIEENVFIGTNSTILKGVTIGKNSVIGACSVVTKSVPPNEIWGGNPAAFIKAIEVY